MIDTKEKAQQDAHKIVFLANEYPNKTVDELAKTIQASAIDVDCAIWRAEELGLIHINKKNGKIDVLEVPEAWDLGPTVNWLIEAIPYSFKKLGEKKTDMEEGYFGNWTRGYPAQDVLIAMKVLLDRGEMATYQIKDVSDSKGKKEISTYTFYTLAKNAKHRWGEKQFKDAKKLKK